MLDSYNTFSIPNRLTGILKLLWREIFKLLAFEFKKDFVQPSSSNSIFQMALRYVFVIHIQVPTSFSLQVNGLRNTFV